MGQPNVIPSVPEFHRLEKQTITKVGKNYRVELEIYREDPDQRETVIFLIPIEICRRPLSVFKVGLCVECGWALFYSKTEEHLVERLVNAYIAAER